MNLQELIGRWEVVWGPVYLPRSQVNLMWPIIQCLWPASLDESTVGYQYCGNKSFISWYNWLLGRFTSTAQRNMAYMVNGNQSHNWFPKFHAGQANGLRIFCKRMQAERSISWLNFLKAYIANTTGGTVKLP